MIWQMVLLTVLMSIIVGSIVGAMLGGTHSTDVGMMLGIFVGMVVGVIYIIVRIDGTDIAASKCVGSIFFKQSCNINEVMNIVIKMILMHA